MVVPKSTDLNRNTSAILDSLRYTDRHLGGQRYDEVTIFVTAERFEAYTGVARSSDIVISAPRESEFDGRSHIWLHEYVHTRQSYSPEGDFAWWTEASANYLSIRMGLRSGYLSPEQYNTVLSSYGENETGHTVLANTSTWHNWSTYKRGVLALSRLDATLRNDTNGSETIASVFNATERTQPQSHSKFMMLLENQTGNQYDEWSDGYIRGTTTGELKMKVDTSPDYIYGIIGAGLVLLIGVYFAYESKDSEEGDNAE
jgi:predicted metalloprotease with PDZ domain